MLTRYGNVKAANHRGIKRASMKSVILHHKARQTGPYRRRGFPLTGAERSGVTG
jgi:hypothetical protein